MHMKELIRVLQPDLDGPCIWMVRPAELVTETVVKAMVKHTGWQTTLVLFGSKSIQGLHNSKVIDHNCDKHGGDEALEVGATKAQAHCGNDFRQL